MKKSQRILVALGDMSWPSKVKMDVGCAVNDSRLVGTPGLNRQRKG